MKGVKPPAPMRGLSKHSAGGTDADEAEEDDAAAGDGAVAAVDLVPRTDIRLMLQCSNS